MQEGRVVDKPDRVTMGRGVRRRPASDLDGFFESADDSHPEGGGAAIHSQEAGGMAGYDLIERVETLSRPRVLVVGDLILDRYVWGDAERISQEAPVPLLRADHREHRLGGAASVATMLRALEAEVDLVGVIGRDGEAAVVRSILGELGIGDSFLVEAGDRPTTLKERYIGRAQDRHPQQMIRVDYEVREPVGADASNRLMRNLEQALDRCRIVLVSDYDKGVCTAEILRELIAAARARGLKVIADPIRGGDYSKYKGVHAMTPNRLEAQLATGLMIQKPEDALAAAGALVDRLEMEAAIVTLDKDGMAVRRRDGGASIHPTRPRQVYDITGAGDMVLSVIGLCLADGADYDEAAMLGNVAGGLEVEKIGVAMISRGEILGDLIAHQHAHGGKRLERYALAAEVKRRRKAGQTVVFTNGCFDLLHVGHVRLLRECSQLGDYVVVGINSDASVRRLKGAGRPLQPEADRAELIAAIEGVNAVTIFEEDTPAELIAELVPDVLVKGGDYAPEEVVGRDVVTAAGGKLVLIPLVAGRSTSGIAARAGDPQRLRAHPAHPAPAPPAGNALGVRQEVYNRNKT